MHRISTISGIRSSWRPPGLQTVDRLHNRAVGVRAAPYQLAGTQHQFPAPLSEQSGLVYEGIEGPVLPVVPRPTVTQATLIKREEGWNDLPTGIAHSPTFWVFREDTFDPVTRTRRGRLYQPEPTQPGPYRVMPD